MRDASLFVLAVEGRVTEEAYFTRTFRSSKVQLEVLPTGEDNRSAPGHVRARLRAWRERYQLHEERDALWLVVDRDGWPVKTLAALAREARQGAYSLAVSNPCFEVWFLLHFTGELEGLERCDEVCARIRGEIGSYSKSNPPVERLRPLLATALARAEDIDAGDRWPSGPGSHVCRLVRDLESRGVPLAAPTS